MKPLTKNNVEKATLWFWIGALAGSSGTIGLLLLAGRIAIP